MQVLDPDFWRRAVRDPVVVFGLAVDLAPVAMVLLFGWGAAPLVMLYWAENLLIGLATIPRILVSGAANSGVAGGLASLFLTGFFVVHYGMFCFGHGVFLFAFLQDMGTGHFAMSPGPDAVLSMVTSLFARWPGMTWLLALTAAFMVFVFVADYIVGKGFRNRSPTQEMFTPYGRIIALHIGIFAGAAALIALGDPMIGVLALILLRAAFGVFANGRERLRFAGASSLPTA